MRRDQLEHIIRAAAAAGAAAAVTGENEFIVVGSQAILGQYPDAPAPLLISMEADLYPPAQPQMSDFIDGSLDPDTLFDKTHGIHADGVSPNTATLPAGWADRLIPICNANTNGATGWCIEVHDIAIAKYAEAVMAPVRDLIARVSDSDSGAPILVSANAYERWGLERDTGGVGETSRRATRISLQNERCTGKHRVPYGCGWFRSPGPSSPL